MKIKSPQIIAITFVIVAIFFAGNFSMENKSVNAGNTQELIVSGTGPGSNYYEYKKLYADDAQASDHFGIVAISDDVIAVGALDENTGGSAAGAVYIFERNYGGPNNWG